MNTMGHNTTGRCPGLCAYLALSGRHSMLFGNCLEGYTMSNRGHTWRRRECPRIKLLYPFISLEGCTWLAYSRCTALQAVGGCFRNSPHILVALVCTGLLIVLPSRQYGTSETMIILYYTIPTQRCASWRKRLKENKITAVLLVYVMDFSYLCTWRIKDRAPARLTRTFFFIRGALHVVVSKGESRTRGLQGQNHGKGTALVSLM